MSKNIKEINFITDTFKSNVYTILKNLFYKLNDIDLEFLLINTTEIINYIANAYGFEIKTIYYKHFLKNDGQDIKSLCLQLIPFVNSYDFEDLNYILYNEKKYNINKDILKMNINKIIKTKFKYSNFMFGLLDRSNYDVLSSLETLEGYKLIYNIIEYNALSLIETIRITNGKLYVNWLNVYPLYDYKTHSFYNKSEYEINEFEKDFTSNILTGSKLIDDYNKYGLWFGDYYNVIRNGYYESIKKIKWVIYNKKIDDKRYYMIQYLTYIFDFSNFFKYDNYDNLDDNQQSSFILKLKSLTTSFKLGVPLYGSNDENLNFEIDIFKKIFYYLVNNSKDRFLLDNTYFGKFKLTLDNEEINDNTDQDFKTNNFIEIDNNYLFNAIDNIDPKIFWNYIKDVLILLKSSIYGSYLIKKDKIDNSFFLFKMDEDKGIINLKNIYNIAKHLSHDQKFIQLGTNYKNLTYQEKIIFFFKYFELDNTNIPLNLRKNIKYQEGYNYNYNEVMNKLFSGFNKIKKYIIWNYLKYNGLLSEFRVNLELTDNNLLPKSTFHKRKEIQRRLDIYFKQDINKKIFNSNYYLTNDNYYNLNKYVNEDKKIFYGESLTGLKNNKKIKDDLIHYTFYANDYISQINIFNHYINHQIMYITGGTGTGKSTQVPKLLLYIMKLYDYNNTGKIICTQPRIAPTEDNAKRISNELGVSIMSDDLKTNEYYLQYKDQQDNHIKENCPHLMLRFVTDGTLLEDLNKNPFLKEKVKKKKTGYIDDYIYTSKNKYDIVIIDEAHEHNTNMDLILTLMRDTCILNNSVRLVIISATMKDDEPIYRSYFKYVNNNIVYPIKQNLDNGIFIDANFIDRRVDISIPGQTTQYNIDEKYFDIKLTGDHRKDSENAQIISYKHIIDITRKYDTGDILLFSTGKREIIQAIDYLNKNLPSGNIALPFYSEMNNKYRDIISKIGSNIDKIRNKRINISQQWGPTFINAFDVPEGTYKRAIIVATNVAEASITINSLKFVVDTGYEKVNKYDENTMSNKMSVEPISESSRIQRKGRVGRTSDGTVYYMYKKNARADIKPKYKIVNDDFHLSFLKLLNMSTSETQNSNNFEIPIIGNMQIPYLNPNYLEVKDNDIKLMNDGELKNVSFFYKKNIYDIYEKQFRNISTIFNYNIIIYNLPIHLITSKYETGYKDGTLIDNYGELYLIHPYENKIERNILNEIISYEGEKKDNIDRSNFINLLTILEVKVEYLNLEQKIGNLRQIDGRKTIYGDKILEINSILTNISENDAITMLMGFGYNIDFEIIQILSLLQALDGSLVSLASNWKIFDKLKQRFGSNSDIMSLYKIIKLLYSNFSNLKIFKLYKNWKENNSDFNKYKEQFKIIIQEFNKFKFTIDKKKIPEKLLSDWNILNSLKYNGKLDIKNGFDTYLYNSKIFKNEIYNDYKKNFNKIKEVCTENNLNLDLIKNYFNILYQNIISLITSERDMENEFGEISSFKWIENISSNLINKLVEPSIENKIINCFLMSSPLQIAVKFDNKMKSLFKFKDVNYRDTFCKDVGSCVFYYSVKSKDNINISILHNLDPIYLAIMFPLHYNPNNIKNYYSIKKNQDYEFIDDYNWTVFINKINNNSNLFYFPLNNKTELPTIYEYISKFKYI